CIERILQNRDDVPISDRPPFDRCQCLTIRGVWEMDILRRHPQQHLSGTPQLAELLKDELDHLLQPAIRIKTEADMPIPGVADRRGDPQLATPVSNSLMLPFMPSSSRSFGRHGS